MVNKRGAHGVDGETVEEFENDLETRLESIHSRLKTGTYRTPPVRRVDIPRGGGKTRPLGISVKSKQNVVSVSAKVVTPIWVEKSTE